MLIGAGLMTTITVKATVAQWVMYQFVAGLGRGCGMQTVRPLLLLFKYLIEATC